MLKRPHVVLIVFALLMALGVNIVQAQTGGFGAGCQQPTRLLVGTQARVTLVPADPNRIRTEPNFGAPVVGWIPAGGVFDVGGGPVCDGSVHWWYVNYNGIVGWTAEGNGIGTYWLEPLTVPPPPPACYQQARLIVGQLGRVTTVPYLPNRIRTEPNFGAAVVGWIQPGSTFDVLGGPACDGSVQWWYVRHAGREGWTAEGDGASTYWLEPAGIIPPPQNCPLPSRLTTNTLGRVTPGLPNIMRSGPGVSGTARVGSIPAGGVFSVVDGPVCAGDRRWWWYVNYNGSFGWTAEGSTSTYWLEPYVGDGPQCALPNRLYIYGRGRVTPGEPNVVRSAPGTQATGANSVVIGQIPGGGVFTVLGGPACGSDSRWWWYIDYAGLRGWTAEGEGSSTYWVEPF
jgi:hypothetical protein